MVAVLAEVGKRALTSASNFVTKEISNSMDIKVDPKTALEIIDHQAGAGP